MVHPLRFLFTSPVFRELPFLFLDRFLQRLIGLCRFRWFSLGNLPYELVNYTENTVRQGPSSVPCCRLVMLIRLVYGYDADVPLDSGVATSDLNRSKS